MLLHLTFVCVLAGSAAKEDERATSTLGCDVLAFAHICTVGRNVAQLVRLCCTGCAH